MRHAQKPWPDRRNRSIVSAVWEDGATPEDDNLERMVRKLTVEHAETRWLTLRLDDDVQELREEMRAVRRTQQQHTEILQAHTGRFDSIDMQLRSLPQMVGQVVERLGEEPKQS